MIVDWAENCEKIYLTKKLSVDDPSDSKSKYKQEIIFLKYLVNVLHLDKKECFKEWKLLSNGIASLFVGEDLQLEIQFDKMYRKSARAKYLHLDYQNKLKPITIFQEEIDFLNKLDVPMWVRQYWGCLLFYYKFEIQNTNRVQKSSTLNSWCIRHTDIKTKRYGSVCQDAIAKCKSSIKSSVIKDFVKTGSDHYPSYAPSFLKTSGTPVYTATRIEELDDFLKFLQPTKHICTNCGKEFQVGSKSRRVLCDECYKIYRRQYKAQNKRIERAKKENVDSKYAIISYDKGEK